MMQIDAAPFYIGQPTLNIESYMCVPLETQFEGGMLRELRRSCSIGIEEGQLHLVIHRNPDDRIIGAECMINARVMWTLKTKVCSPTTKP